jgi:Glucose-6-phosphate isomerase
MAISLNDKYVKSFMNYDDELAGIQDQVTAAHIALEGGCGLGNSYLGWIDLPENYDKDEFARIKAAAKRIQKSCDVFIVIGIGGSYLGARAAIEYVKSPLYNNLKKDTPDIYFTGNSISSSAFAEILALCKDRDVCINVVSKSGTTTEPAVTFRILRQLLIDKYGEDGAAKRIFSTTDKAKGTLKEFSDKMGYETFVVPDDIGGRYSVLTAVGLLPIAVAGIDIDEMMKGAAEARDAYRSPAIDKNDCYKYAALRNILYRKGKTTEIFAAYEPSVQIFSEWWKQLFGESEGKDQKGIFPASVIFSTDLHSLGQYIQDGVRNIFETVLNLKSSNDEIIIPNDPNNIDGLNFISGKTLHEVNQTAMLGTIFAHSDGGVPNIVLEVKDRSAHTFGHLAYFFEKACGISGYLLGVNPFNQPGVEAYKVNMFALLGKAGYEKQRDALQKRIDEQK